MLENIEGNNTNSQQEPFDQKNQERIDELNRRFNMGDEHVQSDDLNEISKWMNLRKEQKERQFGRVVITGGTEGIGREIALEFADRHNAVAICARSEKKLDYISGLFQYFTPKMYADKVDISDRHKGKQFMKEAVSELGGLDALILNASALDFTFKSSGLSKEEISKQMFKTNVVGNVALVRESKEALRVSKGVIAFITTRFGIVEDLETASTVSSSSDSAKEDIGNYIENKRRMQKYLNDFVKDGENEGILAFSIVPGTVDSRANKTLIEYGTLEMSNAKLKEKQEGKERDPRIIGIIIAKMVATRCKFNPVTKQYDVEIKNGEIVEISNLVVEFEEAKRLARFEDNMNNGRYGVYGKSGFYLDFKREVRDILPDRTIFGTHEVMSIFPLEELKELPQDQRIIENEEFSINVIKQFFGEDISNLTVRNLVQMVEGVKSDFEKGIVRITRDDLLVKSGVNKNNI